jgi:hypothetical protein
MTAEDAPTGDSPVPAVLLRLVLRGQADIVLHGRVVVPAKASRPATGSATNAQSSSATSHLMDGRQPSN